MNETLVFHFTLGGQPLPIDELVSIDLDRGGVIVSGETSAWPRGLRFDFEGVGTFGDGLNLLRNQTANGDHRFTVTVVNGALSFTTVNPNRIPTGTYDYRLRIADLDLENGEGRVELRENDAPADIQINVGVERRIVELAETIHSDEPIADLVNGTSLIDGKRIIDWLNDDAPRPKRKACLLNILARLRIAPTEEVPLVNFLQNIFLADVSRIYAKVDPNLFSQLQELDQDPLQPFSLDHGPLDPVHQKLLDRIPQEDQDVTEGYRKGMKSFRQDSQPSLQCVVFPPPDDKPGRGCYADIDIDLGNPKRDVAGFFIHLGELIDEGKTDHIKLNKRLKKDQILNGHLHYTIIKV
jgi:hypothetical protein